MKDLIQQFAHYDNLVIFIRALVYLVAGYFLAKLVSNACARIYRKKRKPKNTVLIRKVVFYVIFILFIVTALQELGFDLKILLGATGILTVALGFASQTSASNFISGLFLLAEQSFQVGDYILINGTYGYVDSVDLFSVKLRQSDNTLVRIPNEMIIKTQFTNLTHYPYRRFDCTFTVSKDIPIEQLREWILPVVKSEPSCRLEPEPTLFVASMTNSGKTVQLYAWVDQSDYYTLKYALQEKVTQILSQHRVQLADSTMNIRLIEGEKDAIYENNVS